ncbi:hypothetical protein Tco_1060001, partial [Tanacetum coccineum]
AATTATTTTVTNAQLKAMIDQGITAALAVCDADRSMNGDDSHNLGTGVRRNDISNCSVENQIKFSICTLLGSDLTWWNSHVRTVSHDVAYAMTWADLKKKMTDKYCPRGEIKKLEVELMFPKESDKIERYVGVLPDMIYGSVNKRKQDDNNNQAQQQPPKKQGVAIAYTAGSDERKEYAGTLPLCNKCKFHHNGQCTVKSDCPKLKNQNHGNQAEGTGARGVVHALGGGETNQDLNNMEDDINA